MTYKIIAKRHLRKYTAPYATPVWASGTAAQDIVDGLCDVPWTPSTVVEATFTNVDGETLDQNVENREQFDAALFCAEHVEGKHRAFANAACYRIPLPDGVLPSLTSLKVRVTSDAYNADGARISVLTNATGTIPTACATVRTGDAHAEGVSPRTTERGSDGRDYWYPTTADCTISPSGGLQLQKYLMVFVLLENYNTWTENWLLGCSYIRNLIEITTDAAIPGWTDGSTIDLTATGSDVSEFNVCRGGVLPPLVGEVSGVQAVDVPFDGSDIGSQAGTDPARLPDETAAIGLRTAYGIFLTGGARQLQKTEYSLGGVVRPGAAFTVKALYESGRNFANGATWTQSSGTSECFLHTAYGNGTFVAASVSSGLWYSTDSGATWIQSSVTGGTWESVVYGNGTFVAASDGSGLWYSADNGATWTQSSLTDGVWRDVAYGDGTFIASGSYGMWLSADGITWTSIPQVGNTDWDVIACGNGKFVAAPSERQGMWYSADGFTWKPSSKSDGICRYAAYGDGTFVAAFIDSGMWYSIDDGATWTQSSRTTGLCSCIAFGNGKFVMSDDFGLWYSTDGGVTWEQCTESEYDPAFGGYHPLEGQYHGIAYGDGTFVAARAVDTGGMVYSADGVAWSGGYGAEGLWNGVAFGNGTFVAGSHGSGLWYSTDGGVHWTQSSVTYGHWREVAFGNGVFVASSLGSGLWYSTDNGVTWAGVPQTDDTVMALFTDWDVVTYGNGKFVAATSAKPGLWYSADGFTWKLSSKSDGTWNDVAFGSGTYVSAPNGMFVAASNGSGLWYSIDDGVTWAHCPDTTGSFEIVESDDSTFYAHDTNRECVLFPEGYWDTHYSSFYNNIDCIATTSYGGTKVAAITGRPGLSYSFNESWVQVSELNETFTSVAYGNGTFVAASIGKGMWYSTSSGRSWTRNRGIYGLTDGDWLRVVYTGGKFVALGSRGMWLSTDGVEWTQSVESSDDPFVSVKFLPDEGKFFAISVSARLYSEDGIMWKRVPVNPFKDGRALAYGCGTFVTTFAKSGLWYSTDNGRTWVRSSKTDGNWIGLVYGNGTFVALSGVEFGSGTYSGLWYSTDNGVTWTHGSDPDDVVVNMLAYGNGTFVAGVGANDGLWYSADGSTWTQSSKTDGNWSGLAYGNGVFVASSSNGPWYSPPVLLPETDEDEGEADEGNDGDGGSGEGNEDGRLCWKIMSSCMFVRTSVPRDFHATKVRIDWPGWTGTATEGAKFNVWLKRGEFSDAYDGEVVKNHVIYDAEADSAGGYELVGTIDATIRERTATLELSNPLTGEVATFLLTAYVSMDRMNPSVDLSLPVGASTAQHVDSVGKLVIGVESGWRPDITLLG